MLEVVLCFFIFITGYYLGALVPSITPADYNKADAICLKNEGLKNFNRGGSVVCNDGMTGAWK